ncbi:MAG: dTMP kinase [Alphaproteobacteria bacterium]
MTRGRFITLEGGEGAGKSTQAALLAQGLGEAGLAVLATREPGGAPGAEQIRALLVDGAVDRWDAATEALLHFAARRDHLVRTVWPALEEGRWVVCDRFADSTMAYQGYGLGLGREVVECLYRVAVGDFAPDLTLILDLPVAAGLGRAAGRGGEQRYERMGLDFHERLREGFLDIARREPDRCVVVDAAGEVAEVQAAIRTVVSERLELKLA